MKRADFTRIPMEDLIAIPGNGTWRHIVNNYWLLDENCCALQYRRISYQHNADERVLISMLEDEDHPAVSSQLIPSAWLPYDTSEYT